MKETSRNIDTLVAYALSEGLIAPEDRVYAINRLLAVLGESEYVPAENGNSTSEIPVPAGEQRGKFTSPQPILDALLEKAAANGTLESNTPVYRDLLDTELMAGLTPPPSAVIAKFRQYYADSPEKATSWYYRFSQATNYIRTDRIARDVRWEYNSPWGELIITINLSKPEKDPVAIANAKKQKQSAYPACAICPENEGYAGTVTQAARGNHRILPITLGGEDWFWQYSPYVYYNEHCIALNKKHTPMVINRATFGKLLDFTDIFPHYFIGSNADLPIVGGSILTHDHFQGGKFRFPMAEAPVGQTFDVSGLQGVSCGIVEWPMSVLRLSGTDKKAILDLAEQILARWKTYSDESVEIFAFTGDTPHNTITPIARRRGNQYELDLVLRNNRTTDEHPLGLFHPHAEKHHIKKENIGLIEVMGLAVLPARLKNALSSLADCWAGGADCFAENAELLPHKPWFDEIASREKPTSRAEAEEILKREVGRVFAGCLEDAGVFKQTEAGREAFVRFVKVALEK
ncbi:MAG TPA: UDP-glucose--hexose-1-phosphate uridylyltransferase [Clostridiales bacterium]|nr:UDP-glucose--hexose-1-phosphate uridylyltransferase [Clostridiales bacterium]